MHEMIYCIFVIILNYSLENFPNFYGIFNIFNSYINIKLLPKLYLILSAATRRNL